MKKEISKRLLSIMLSLALVFTMMPWVPGAVKEAHAATDDYNVGGVKAVATGVEYDMIKGGYTPVFSTITPITTEGERVADAQETLVRPFYKDYNGGNALTNVLTTAPVDGETYYSELNLHNPNGYPDVSPEYVDITIPGYQVEYLGYYESDSGFSTRIFYKATKMDVDYTPVYVGGVQLLDGQYLGPKGAILTKKPTGEVGYAYYKDGALTLHNYSYTGSGTFFAGANGSTESAGIYAIDSLTVILSGKNIFDVDDNGIYVDNLATAESKAAELTLIAESGGSIEITSGDMAFYAKNNLIVENGTFDVDSKGSVFCAEHFVRVKDGTFNIKTDGTAFSVLLGAKFEAGDINITKSKVGISAGMYADSALEIKGGTIDIVSEEIGLRVIDSGTLKISGGKTNVLSRGGEAVHSANTMTVSGGELNATGESGIYSAYKAQISGGNVSARAVYSLNTGGAFNLEPSTLLEMQASQEPYGTLSTYSSPVSKYKLIVIGTPTIPTYTCKVDFLNDGGTTGSMPAMNAVKFGEIIELPECTFTQPEGKVFYGWKNSNSDSNTPYQPNDTLQITEDVSFVTNWVQILTSAEAVIDTPKIGKQVAITATTPEGAKYTAKIASWYDYTRSKLLSSTAVFEEGRYLLRIRFYPNEGYIFAENGSFTINGQSTYNFSFGDPALCASRETAFELCNHEWDTGTITTQPTCVKEGVKTYKCADCSETKTEPVAKLTTHIYGADNKCTECGIVKPGTGGSTGGGTTPTPGTGESGGSGGTVTPAPTPTPGTGESGGSGGSGTPDPGTPGTPGTGSSGGSGTPDPGTPGTPGTGSSGGSGTPDPGTCSHNWNAATCTAAKTCTLCGATEGAALGHKAGTAKVTKKATASKAGTKVQKCTVCSATVKTIKIKPAKVSLSKDRFAYTGKVISSKKLPKIVVKDGNGKKIAAKYYTVKKPKNVKKMKAIGRYAYKITFKKTCKEYTGVKTVYLQITPKKTSITKVQPAKKAVTVKWKKGKKAQVTGYQVTVATNKKFTKNVKTKKIKGYSKTSYKMTKLKAKKKYYVKVRTYKTVKGVKIYSDWSKVKTVKTK